jgi:hypothetical protein
VPVPVLPRPVTFLLTDRTRLTDQGCKCRIQPAPCGKPKEATQAKGVIGGGLGLLAGLPRERDSTDPPQCGPTPEVPQRPEPRQPP